MAIPESIREDINASQRFGLYLDLSALSNDSGGNRISSAKLSRMGRSDPVEENDCYEGWLEKKSPKLFVGWQVYCSFLRI